MLLSGALLHCILVYFWIALDNYSLDDIKFHKVYYEKMLKIPHLNSVVNTIESLVNYLITGEVFLTKIISSGFYVLSLNLDNLSEVYPKTCTVNLYNIL